MYTFEIISPLGLATMLAPDRTVALGAIALLDCGLDGGLSARIFGIPPGKEEADTLAIPPFAGSATNTYERWWPSAGYSESPIEVALRTRRGELVAALRSCVDGSAADRVSYGLAVAAVTAPEHSQAFRTAAEERRRTTTNQVVRKAWSIADDIEMRGV